MRLILISLFSAFISLGTLASSPIVSFDSNVDDLFAQLQGLKVTSLKSALSHFDDQFFSRGHYALIFNSRSPQLSSPDAPRILMFGKNRHLRIGFNHNNRYRQHLEIIQWRKYSKSWEFREIRFTKSGPNLSKANPGQCLQYHDNSKPKYNYGLRQISRDPFQGSRRDLPFAKKINSDPIYERLESPLVL